MANTNNKIQMSFKDEHKSFYIARDVANFLNKGSAIRDKIETVFNQIRETTGIHSIKNLTQETIQSYIDDLKERKDDGDLTTKTTATYISALNDIISYTNEKLNKNLETVSAKEAGLSRGKREYNNRAVSPETHQAFVSFLEQKSDIKAQALIHSVELQRQFGLRLRESESIKAKTIEKALEKGKLELGREDGTKNSKERTVPIRNEAQIQTLKSALSFMQKHNLKSLIPSEKLLSQYNYAEKAKQEFNKLSNDKMDFHGERYHYAQERISEGATYKEVSQELGHEREEITRIYLAK